MGTFRRLFLPTRERQYEEKCRNRPVLTDAEFIERFYGCGAVPSQIPIRLRMVVSRELGMRKILPDDNILEVFPDLDLAELLYEIQEELGLELSREDMKMNDGTFDSLVQCVAQKYFEQRQKGETGSEKAPVKTGME